LGVNNRDSKLNKMFSRIKQNVQQIKIETLVCGIGFLKVFKKQG
jgi:hypothetical protein